MAEPSSPPLEGNFARRFNKQKLQSNFFPLHRPADNCYNAIESKGIWVWGIRALLDTSRETKNLQQWLECGEYIE
jgi:hypothetical protein